MILQFSYGKYKVYDGEIKLIASWETEVKFSKGDCIPNVIIQRNIKVFND